MNTTKLFPTGRACLCLILLLAGVPIPSIADGDIAAAIRDGKTSLGLRYRYESVDQANTLKNASAPTLRTTLGLTSGTVAGWRGLLEFEDVAVVGGQAYNSGSNGRTQYSLVRDPVDTEVNQAYLDYAGLSDTLIRWGRQRIIIDNARFVGNVGWRQNEQTFDALTLTNDSVSKLGLSYSYVTNVNTIDGTNVDMSSSLVHLAYTGFSPLSVIAYGYFLDFTNTTGDSKSLGIRATGETAIGEPIKALYTLEYAKQSEYADAPSTVDADYLFAEAGVKGAAFMASIGYEVLGGDGIYGFSTPLATKHAFNGWADIFLSTPVDGLKDAMLTVGGTVTGVKLEGVYHDFSADNGGANYGTEIDLLAVKKFGDHYTLGAKYANYSADSYAVDTRKYWVWVQAGF
jgi:hypothetical protein